MGASARTVGSPPPPPSIAGAGAGGEVAEQGRL